MVMALTIASTKPALAATLSWTGAASMGWNETDSNWGGPLWNNATPDSAVFGATGVGQVNLTTAITASSITFNMTGYTIASNTLTLGAALPSITNNADVTIASVLAGTDHFSKVGAGRLTLSGDNVFSGNLSIVGGSILLQHSRALGDTNGSTSLISGTKVQLQNDINVAENFSSSFGTIENLSGTNTLRGVITKSGNPVTLLATAGQLILAGDIGGSVNSVFLQGAGSGEISGAIATAFALVKTNAGTWTLSGTNTFTGNTTVNGGTLAVTGGGRLYYDATNVSPVVTVNAGATLELDSWWKANTDSLGLLAEDAARIVVNGGTIRMKGITGYGRGVTVNSGGATFESAAGADWFLHNFNGTAAFVYNGNPTLVFTGAGVGHFWKAITGGCTVIKRGTGRWSLLGEGSSYTGNTIVEQGVLRIMRATLTDTATVIIQRGGILDLWHDDTDKVGALVINGVTMPSGTYNRTTHPEYFIGRGSLIVGGAASTGSTALTYYTSGEESWPAGKETAITNSMNGCLSYYNAYGTYGRLGGNIKIQYNASVPTANAAQGGPITFGGSISTHTAIHEMAHVMGTGTAWQWDYHRASGQWLGPHANNLVYQIDHNRSIGCDPAHFWPYNINYPNEDSTKARQVSPMVVAAMRRDMGIFNDPPTISTVADQIVSTNMSTGAIPFTIGDPDTAVSSLNVTVFSSNTNLVPVNNIFLSGTGTNRTVTVTPTGSQGGSAVITLFVMDSEWATPTSFTVSIGSGAPTAYHWLVGNGTWDTVTPNWWGLGTLWPNSGNDHAIIGSPSGTISLVPGMMVNRVMFNSSATIQSNTLSLSGALPELSAQGGATGVVATVVSGSAGLTKQGAGTVILSRTNNYTGVTTIQDGVLQLGDGVSDGALAGSPSIVVSNNGVFGVNLISSRALSQTISGNGGLLKSGPATLNLTNANTYTGPTTVSAGTLVVSNNHASSAHTIAAGTVLELNTATGEKNYGTTTFSGSGTLRKSGANRAYWGATAATFALGSGALIDVQGGTLTAGSNANEDWTANQSDLNVATGAIFDGVEANVRVDAIIGTGTIKTGYGGAGYTDFTIGVANGSSTFDGVIANSTSTGNLTKEGSGTITLTKANTYTGTTAVGAGKLRIAHSSALGTSAGGTSVQGGDSSATLELAGTNLVIAGEVLTLTGKQGNNANTAHLRNVSGTNTWTGAMQTQTGGNMYNLESQSGLLTVSGPLNNSLSGRYWQLLGSGDGVVSGVIGGGSSPSTTYVIKSGSGTWTLSATNLYTATTTINAGTLRVTGILANTAVTNDGGTLSGNGVINGPVAIVSGTLAPGASAALNETLTIRNDLVLGDTARFQIGKSGATPVCDRVVGVTNITYDGTLIVTNVTGAIWVNSDSFNLFSASGTKSGNFTNIVLQPAVAGVTPSFNPATGNLSLSVIAPPILNVSRTGGSLQFTWTGSFKLQSQTNNLVSGLGTNWFDYPGGSNSPVNVTVNPAQPSVFFRLISP